MFRAEAVIVREVNGIKIVFYNHETIYVRNDKGEWVIFHRWFPQRGSYTKGWLQFRHLLLYEKKITLNHCYRLAFRYDIDTQYPAKEPDLSKFKIQERF